MNRLRDKEREKSFCTVVVGVVLALDQHDVDAEHLLDQGIHELQVAHRHHDLVH
jgi:hypothetical protein